MRDELKLLRVSLNDDEIYWVASTRVDVEHVLSLIDDEVGDYVDECVLEVTEVSEAEARKVPIRTDDDHPAEESLWNVFKRETGEMILAGSEW
ncbi:MAG: hypothetical protein AAGE52_01465 [Myxococcota bacterium]